MKLDESSVVCRREAQFCMQGPEVAARLNYGYASPPLKGESALVRIQNAARFAQFHLRLARTPNSRNAAPPARLLLPPTCGA